MRISVRELITYLIASGIAFAVDVSTLAFLVHIANWHYVLASIIAFITGGLVLYVLAISYVFRFRRLTDPRIEGPVFIALGLIGLGVNTVVMVAVIESTHAHFLVAKVVSAACTFGMNYLLRRRLLFTPPRAAGVVE